MTDEEFYVIFAEEIERVTGAKLDQGQIDEFIENLINREIVILYTESL